ELAELPLPAQQPQRIVHPRGVPGRDLGWPALRFESGPGGDRRHRTPRSASGRGERGQVGGDGVGVEVEREVRRRYEVREVDELVVAYLAQPGQVEGLHEDAVERADRPRLPGYRRYGQQDRLGRHRIGRVAVE